MRAKTLLATVSLLVSVAALASAAECPVREFGPNASVNATLASTDCRYSDLIVGGKSQSYVQQYKVVLQERLVLTLETTAAGFDTYLYLFDGKYNLYAYNDNISRTNTNSRIVMSLDPGAYIIFASAKSAAQLGDYTLKTSSEVSPTCPVEELPPGGTMAGELTESDCRYLDVFTFSTDTSRVKQYALKVPGTSVLTAELLSPAFETYMELNNSAGEYLTAVLPTDGSNDSRMLVSLTADTYTLLVSTNDFGIGPFTLNTGLEPPRTCNAKPINPDETLQGNFAMDNCRFLDVFIPSDDDTFLDLYTLTLNDPSLVTLNMKSADFDAYAGLLDSAGDAIAEDDDSGGGSDARIVTSLNPGTYTIYANTMDSGITGAYTLAMAAEPLRACPGKDLAPGTLISGTILADGCRALDLFIPGSNRTLLERFNFTVPQKSVPALEASSVAAPIALSVYDGALLRVNGVSGTAANPGATLSLLLKPGSYVLAVSLVGNKTGDFTLKSELTEPKNCPVEDLGLNATAGGVFSASDCALTDVLPGTTSNTPAKQYRLQITEPGSIALSISSPDTDVDLGLLDSQDNLLDVAVGGAEPAAIKGTFKPGTYTLLVLPDTGSTGTYTLKTEFTPGAAQQ